MTRGKLDETPAFRCRSGASTDIGAVRTVNEDAYLDHAAIGLWAVADGLGGEMAGDRASRAIVESLGQAVRPKAGQSLLDEVCGRLETVNASLLREAEQANTGRLIASTVVALLIQGGDFACAWAGDSRLYLLRQGALRQITEDHTQLQLLIAEGHIDRADAGRHPGADILTRAVGAAPVLRLAVRQDRLSAGDVFLLCSDGLTKMLRDAEIAALLAGRDPRAAADALVAETLARGAWDNVTVVVVHVSAATTDG